MSTSATPPIDSDARARALEPSTSFIVQAPAGSGKTALLTRRVLTLLATVNEPEEILAITFTRKAASEMRSRVVEALEQAASSEPPTSTFEREGYDLAQSVLQRDAELDWRLLENPDRLRMSTIDALCSMLAQQLPVTSTLGGVANPLDDASSLYREAARRRLKADMSNYAHLLATVGNRFDRAEQLLANLLASRDQWLRYRALFDVEDRAVLRSWLEDQLKDLVTRELQAFDREVKHARVDHHLKTTLLPMLQSASEAMDALGVYKPGVKEARESFLSLSVVPELVAEHLSTWQALLQCVFTADQKSIRKQVTRADGFPTKKEDLDAIGISAADAKAGKTAFAQLLKAFAEAPGLQASMMRVLGLPQPQYADAHWALLEELLTELPGLERTLHQVFVDQGAIDFIEIATRARLALGSEDAPTDLALSMDLRLKHILVDEFQDTSRSQFELFRQLVAGWQRGDGRSFFVVGDPMQSIYAFRAAEVGLFSIAKTYGITDDVTLEPLTLQVNFRSSPDVVNWVNETFAEVFVPEEEADPAMGAIAYSASVAHQTATGCVRVHPLLDQSADDAGEQVAQLVASTLASPEYQNNPDLRIAILVRSRNAAIPIFGALQRKGIANLSVDMDSLGEQPVVMDLVSLTLALRLPHSRLHWLAILRAPWCGLGLDDLHALTRDVEFSRSMPALINDAERLATLSQTGQSRLTRFLTIIQPAIERAERTSLVSWVEAIWLQLGGPVLCQREVDKNAAERCLQTLYELEAQGELWQPQVIQHAMDRLFAITPDDGSAKVHIMTMHKSKGLEFDTVILPGLNRSTRVNDTQLLDWAVMDTAGDGKAALLLAPMTERNASKQDKSLGRLVKNLNAANDEQESRRLLYVACTRAVRQLYLVASLRVPADGEMKAQARSLLEPLWPIVKPEFDAALQALPPNPDDDDASADDSIDPLSDDSTMLAAPLLQRVAENWQVPVLPNYSAPDGRVDEVLEDEQHSVDYLWAGRSARAIGTVVHRQLERFHSHGVLTEQGVSELEPVVMRQLRQQGLPENEVAESAKVVLQALIKVSNDETGRWLYDSSHTQPRAEWALTVSAGERTERRVIDRTFITQEGTRWVVDFKTGDHKGGDLEGFLASEVERHGPQLRRYADILAQMESAPLRLALYFPLLQAFREVPTE